MILKMSILLPRIHHEQDRPVSASSHPKKSTQHKKKTMTCFFTHCSQPNPNLSIWETHTSNIDETLLNSNGIKLQIQSLRANDKGQGAMSNLIKTWKIHVNGLKPPMLWIFLHVLHSEPTLGDSLCDWLMGDITLPETNRCTLKIRFPKRKGSFPSHFSGVNSLLVLGRVNLQYFQQPSISLFLGWNNRILRSNYDVSNLVDWIYWSKRGPNNIQSFFFLNGMLEFDHLSHEKNKWLSIYNTNITG